MTSHSGATLRRAFLLVPLICAALLVTGCASQPPAKRGLTAEQIAALKELGFRQVDEGWELLTDANVLFATGEFKLTQEAFDQPPRDLAQALRERGLPDQSVWLLRHGETRAIPVAGG